MRQSPDGGTFTRETDCQEIRVRLLDRAEALLKLVEAGC